MPAERERLRSLTGLRQNSIRRSELDRAEGFNLDVAPRVSARRVGKETLKASSSGELVSRSSLSSAQCLIKANPIGMTGRVMDVRPLSFPRDEVVEIIAVGATGHRLYGPC
jgi:hypothetical protein